MNHRQIIELLPWYANRTLDADESKMVEAHLAGCGECARELQKLSVMQKAVVELGDRRPALPPQALNRALAEIEDYERSKAGSAAGQSDQSKSLRRPMTAFWTGWWRPTPVFARALIAAQIAVVLALGTVTIYQHTHPNVIYTTASGGTADEKDSSKLVIGFNQGVTEQEIRQVILGIKGKIVDGPSALGLYTVQVPIPRERTAEIEQVLETLRQNQHVVRFAAQQQ